MIFVTGASGFLGKIIVRMLLVKTQCDVVAFVHDKNHTDTYFDETLNLYSRRLRVFEGDLSKKFFGLSPEDYGELMQQIDVVIHCAALVKHFGQYEDFFINNVLSTKRLLSFCKNKRLFFVSTLSVGGELKLERQELGETVYALKRTPENFYAYSKAEAENLVFADILDGADAFIIRIGAIPFNSDKSCIANKNTNALLKLVESIQRLKLIPHDLKIQAQFADSVSDLIVSLVVANSKNVSRVLNIADNNVITARELLDFFQKKDANFRLISRADLIAYASQKFNKEEMVAAGFLLTYGFSDRRNFRIDNTTFKQMIASGISWKYVSIKDLLVIEER